MNEQIGIGPWIFLYMYLFFDASDSLQYFLNHSECYTRSEGVGGDQMHNTSTVQLSNAGFFV
jgi:hypothetical protein